VRGREEGTGGVEARGGDEGVTGAPEARGADEGVTGGAEARGADEGVTGGAEVRLGKEEGVMGGAMGVASLAEVIERREIAEASSEAAFASASARMSSSASAAASAALRTHLIASMWSPRAHMASAVDSAQETSSGSSGFASGTSGRSRSSDMGAGSRRSSVMADAMASLSRGFRRADAPGPVDSRGIEGDRNETPMQVTINGQAKQVPDGLTVRALVVHLGLGEGPVAVEINRAIVPRAEHPTRAVSSGDAIEIVHLVGGG
jgi:sulfur carrier protein